MKKKLQHLIRICFCLSLLTLCTACSKDHNLDPDNPVTLTMWHNYGGTMQSTMDSLIDEFNTTVGKENGIIINVTAITSSSELQQTMNSILNDDPGAPELPDITTSYPKTAILFQKEGMLADLTKYFNEDELELYIPEFIDEGIIDGGLYVFPIAKSTEILYLNQTLFDRFSTDTGITLESLSSFEGILYAGSAYAGWSGGKSFFAADSWLNLVQSAMQQQGSILFKDNEFSMENEEFFKIWDICYKAVMKDAFLLYDGYSSDFSKTGDILCSTGSSAGISFYSDTVTYPDGSSETVKYSILPYPTMENAQNIAIQRGNGLIVTKSNSTREYAASIFLKWLTDPAQNMRFISQTGYLPVTKAAFEDNMEEHIATVDDVRIKDMLTAVTDMLDTYSFYVAPVYEDFDNDSNYFESKFKEFLLEEKSKYNESIDLDTASKEAYKSFIQFFR